MVNMDDYMCVQGFKGYPTVTANSVFTGAQVQMQINTIQSPIVRNQEVAIDCCPTNAAVPAPESNAIGREYKKKNKQEKNMFYNDDMELTANPTTENERKATYFMGELNMASYNKREELLETFKMSLQDRPDSPKEYAEWIKAGYFTFAKSNLNDDGSWRDPKGYKSMYDMDRYIVWNNPARDTTGFSAAEDKLETASKNTQWAITAASAPAEMLKALQDFESQTFN